MQSVGKDVAIQESSCTPGEEQRQVELLWRAVRWYLVKGRLCIYPPTQQYYWIDGWWRGRGREGILKELLVILSNKVQCLGLPLPNAPSKI